MRTIGLVTLSGAVSFGLLASAMARPTTNPAAITTAVNTNSAAQRAPAAAQAATSRDQTPQPATGAETAQTVVSETIAPANAQAEALDAVTNTVAEFPPGKGLRMNFRGVPLETVLNYMSQAGGFIIHPRVSINGKVDAWSDQPLSKEEALDLLKHVLHDNGYATVQDGRILTIISSVDAKKSEIPVVRFTSIADIPQSPDVATYIIPVRTLNPIALVKNLQPLVSADTDLQANESANSLLITDTQINIRRIAEIVVKLDSVSSTINSIKVYTLKYADAKTVADLIKELFPSTDGSGNRQGGMLFGRAGGAGGPGSARGRAMAALFGLGGVDAAAGTTPTSRIAAVSDDHSNAVIVSAPEDLIPNIDDLVEKLDQPVEDITQVKLFHLAHADATEMAGLLANLFPDQSNSADATQSIFQFRGRGGAGARGGRGTAMPAANADSDHMKKLYHVVAVPDERTQSLLVSASKDLMPQIEEMVNELDENSSNTTHVHVIKLKNADPMDLETVLQDIFPAGNGSRSSLNSSTQNPLLQRQTTLLQQQYQSSASGMNLNSTGSRSGL